MIVKTAEVLIAQTAEVGVLPLDNDATDEQGHADIDHLVDARGGESVQLVAQRLGGARQRVGQRAERVDLAERIEWGEK